MFSLAQNLVLSKSGSVVSTTFDDEQQFEGELSLFAMADQKILDLVYATHVHHDHSFDVDSMFLVVENIIKRSGQIVDNVVQVYIHTHTYC